METLLQKACFFHDLYDELAIIWPGGVAAEAPTPRDYRRQAPETAESQRCGYTLTFGELREKSLALAVGAQKFLCRG